MSLTFICIFLIMKLSNSETIYLDGQNSNLSFYLQSSNFSSGLIFIISPNTSLFIFESMITINQNVSLLGSGTNNTLILMNSLFELRKNFLLISKMDLRIENSAYAYFVFQLGPQASASFQDCEIFFNITNILRTFIRLVWCNSLMLNNVKLINQNLTQLNIFLHCEYNIQINLKNLYFYGNIFPQMFGSYIFSLKSAIFIMLDSIFIQNIMFQFLSVSSTVYMSNNLFQDNILSLGVISIENIYNAMISNFTIDSNIFIFFFEMKIIQETLSFQNISFTENNNQNFSHYADLFPFLPEAKFTLVGPYGACIMLISISNVNMSFLFFNRNSGNLFSSTNIIISSTKNVLLNNSEFKNNIQKKCSGIKCSVGLSLDSSQNITLSMENLFFINNSILEITETPSGPCMYIEPSLFLVSIKNSVFDQNFNNLWSLCIYIVSYNILVQNCSFVNHIYNDQSLYFTLNKTRMGVILVDFLNLTILNSIFSNNKAFQGTSLYILGSNFRYQIFYQENVTYFQNSAFSSASSIYVESSLIDREYYSFSCYFLHSITIDDLGLFYFGSIYGLYLQQHFNFSLCSFFGNMGSTSAAVTELYPPDPVNIFLFFNECIFANNSQIKSQITVGGLINIWGEALALETNIPALRIERSIFRNHNFSSGLFYGNRAYFTDSYSLYLNNVGENGLFSLVKSKVVIYKSNIYKIRTQRIGGVVSLQESSRIALDQCIIYEINSYQGALANVDVDSNFTMRNCYVENSQSVIGTLLYVSNGFQSYIYIKDSQFFNISCSDSFLFFLQYGTFIMKNCEFAYSENLILVLGAKLFVSQININNSLCQSKGCILSSFDQAYTVFDGFSVSNIKGVGAIYSHSSTFYLENSNFSNIVSESDGTLLYSDLSTIFIVNSSFSNFKYDLIYLIRSDISINKSLFDNILQNAYLEHSLINSIMCRSFEIIGTVFTNIASLSNGTCIKIDSLSNSSSYIIRNSSFRNNTSKESGGAIFHLNSRGIIEKCVFGRNNARIGGAFLEICSSLSCYVILLNNDFKNNKASIEGGAIKWYYTPPRNIPQNTFENNTAQIYGDNVADRPSRFCVLLYNRSNNTIVDLDFRDNFSIFNQGILIYGQRSATVLKKIEVMFLDFGGKIYKTQKMLMMKVDLINDFDGYENADWLKSLKLKYKNEHSDHINETFLYGTLNTINDQKTNSFIFDQIYTVGGRNSIVFLRFIASFVSFNINNLQSNLIPNEIYNNSSNSYYFIIPILMSECQLGEVFDELSNKCIFCSPGKYVLFLNQTTCLPCPSNAYCRGGSDITLYPGFWRSSVNSTKIYECLTEGVCLGDLCAGDHKGIFCEECIEGSKKNAFGICNHCQLDKDSFIGNVFCLILGTLIILAVIWFFNSNSFSEVSKSSFKIMVNYVHSLYFFPFWLLIEETREEYRFFILIRNQVMNFSNDFLSFECFLLKVGFHDVSIFHILVIKWIYTIFLFLVSLFILIALGKFRVKNKPMKSVDILSIMTVVTYLTFPFIVKNSFAPLICVEVDEKTYIQTDFQIECWTREYSLAIGLLCIPTIFIWAIWIPLMKGGLFKFNRLSPFKPKQKKENKSKFMKMQRLSFVENNIILIGYHSISLNWEKAKYAHKLYLIVIISIFERQKLRILFSLFSYCLFLLISWKKNPYKLHKIKILENFHLGIFIGSYAGLFFRLAVKHPKFDAFVVIMMISSNLLFFMVLCCELFSSSKKAIIEKIFGNRVSLVFSALKKSIINLQNTFFPSKKSTEISRDCHQ